MSEPLARGGSSVASPVFSGAAASSSGSVPLARGVLHDDVSGRSTQTQEMLGISTSYPMPVEVKKVSRHRVKVPKQPLFPFTV